jgi:hypothetical protein
MANVERIIEKKVVQPYSLAYTSPIKQNGMDAI